MLRLIFALFTDLQIFNEKMAFISSWFFNYYFFNRKPNILVKNQDETLFLRVVLKAYIIFTSPKTQKHAVLEWNRPLK